MKKVLIIIGAILVAGLLSAGSFFGGMQYQIRQANQVRQNFLNTRGFGNGNGNGNNGQFPNGSQGGGQFGGFARGGTFGQIKSIDGNTLTISTPQSVITVNLDDTTRITKMVDGTSADLQPGMQVTVSGPRDNNGKITSVTQITIIPSTGTTNNTAGGQNPAAAATSQP
jgi:hypothetical protein